MMFSSPLP